MTRFLYTGPDSAATLVTGRAPDGTPEQVEVLLWHGHPVELPAGHELVQVLLHKGYLQPAAQDATAAGPAPATGAGTANKPAK